MKATKIKKQQIPKIAGIVFIVLALGVMLFFDESISNDVKSLSKELIDLEQEIDTARNILQEKRDLKVTKPLINQEDISPAIDEITKIGNLFEVNFISISPKDIQRIPNRPYDRLPINMELKSSYRNLGTFLGSLEDLNKSIVYVKSFEINRLEEEMPLVKSKVTLEMYLNNGQNK